MHKNLQNVHKQGHLRNDKSDRSRLAKTFFTVHEGRVGLPAVGIWQKVIGIFGGRQSPKLTIGILFSFASFLVYKNTENALVFYRKSY